MINEPSFGAWLKERRKSADLTQEALADRAGCSRDMVRKIEAGIARPSRQLTGLLLDSLQTPLQDQSALMIWARTGRLSDAVAPSSGSNDLGHHTVGNDGSSGNDVNAPGSEAENPYKGLRAFQERDAPDFFGREPLTARLLSRISGTEEFSRFLTVVGPSGSGKSSVVRAGLVPALRDHKLPGGLEPLVADLVPGTHPLEELEAAFLRVAVNPPSSLMEQLTSGERGLVRAVKRVLPSDDRTEMLLVIDQFEELFTLTRSEEERTTLLNALFEAVTDPLSRLWVVVTLRADFYDHPLMYIPSSELVGRRTEVVGPLTEAELYRAITGPAERVGLSMEAQLPATIIEDVAEQPGALPLMQYALTELYEQRRGRLLSLSAYRESGGVLGALARRAESLYAGLTGAEQAEARQLFLRLVTLGEEAGVEDTRRRVRRSEVASAARDEAALGRVLDLYGRYRMLTFDRDPLRGVPTVEVAHEALLRSWPRLREWLDANRERLRVQRRLMLAASEWRSSGNDASYLASGVRLAQFGELASEGDLSLTAEEMAYLSTGLDEQRRRDEDEAQRRTQQFQLQKRAADRLRVLVAALAVFLVVGGTLAAWALNRSEVAQANEHAVRASLTHAQALRLGTAANALALQNGENQLVALLAIRALGIEYTPEGDAALSRAAALSYPLTQFKGHSAGVRDVTFSADGKRVLTSSDDKTARVWDAATGQQLLAFSGHTAEVYTAAYSPDGKNVVTASEDHTARLWDAGTGKQIHVFSGGDQPVQAAVFSPDGKHILTGGFDKTARLWDISGDRSSEDWGRVVLTFTGHSDGIIDVAFSPDGKYVLTSSVDSTARLWDASTGKQLRVFSGHTDAIDVVAYSPDGKYIATGSCDSTARIWDVTTGDQLYVVTGPQGCIEGIAFSPDGRYLLVGGSATRLWSILAGQEVRRFVTPENGVNRVAFSPDGNYLLTGTGGIGSYAYLWQTQALAGEVQLLGHWGQVMQVSFSKDGKRMLTAGTDATARIWDTTTGQELKRFRVRPIVPIETLSAVFSPDERYVLTGNNDKIARLWEVQTGQQVLTFTGHTDAIRSVAFSPDGKYLVTASYDGTARTWETATGRNIVTFSNHMGEDPSQALNVNIVAFSPNGKTVVTSGDDMTARIWDPMTGKELQTMRGHTGVVAGVGFSPDGNYLVTASFDGTARLWDVKSGRELRQFLGHAGAVTAAKFSPDGKTVLTSGIDQTARLWDVATGREVRRFVGHTGLVHDVALSPDGQYIATASSDHTAAIWRTDYHDTIHYVCGVLTRDLTDTERAQYDITGKEPTCPKP